MESGESPLEVLSRAATMVQENQQAAEDSAKQSNNNKQLTTKWKRDRRLRLPEYSRKSDPKIPENFDAQSPHSPDINNQDCNNGPLDMTVRQRGLPPSYSQTVNNPGYRSSYRPSVIQNNREELPPGISMCDPIIDEHFRRSLGNDYLTLFSNNNITKDTLKPSPTTPTPVPAPTPTPTPTPPPPPPPPPSVPPPKLLTTKTESNVIELMDPAGLSVDDHFAKALGDTWIKLNKKEPEIKNTTNNDNNLVSI